MTATVETIETREFRGFKVTDQFVIKDRNLQELLAFKLEAHGNGIKSWFAQNGKEDVANVMRKAGMTVSYTGLAAIRKSDMWLEAKDNFIKINLIKDDAEIKSIAELVSRDDNSKLDANIARSIGNAVYNAIENESIKAALGNTDNGNHEALIDAVSDWGYVGLLNEWSIINESQVKAAEEAYDKACEARLADIRTKALEFYELMGLEVPDDENDEQLVKMMDKLADNIPMPSIETMDGVVTSIEVDENLAKARELATARHEESTEDESTESTESTE